MVRAGLRGRLTAEKQTFAFAPYLTLKIKMTGGNNHEEIYELYGWFSLCRVNFRRRSSFGEH